MRYPDLAASSTWRKGVLVRSSWLVLLLAAALLPLAGRPQDPEGSEVARLRDAMERVRPLYKPMLPTLWPYSEEGQTFRQYLASRPYVPDGKRRVLYVQPVGSFTPAELRLAELTADYLERSFGLPVRLEPPLPLGPVPSGAHRFNPLMETEQIKIGYVMDLLERDRPDDAFAQIGLTAADLYPSQRWNYVFGEAVPFDRVGVWSLYRFGLLDKSPEERSYALVRTLKTATHEMGHLFSIEHCTKHQCVMNASNSLDELDSHPLDTCPECMAKICWATGYDPRRRFERIAGFFARQGMSSARDLFLRRRDALAADKAALVLAARGAK
ncbi:MAG TPA: archaemetzincin [Thermoanaerobaculia bacterium]